MSTPVVPSNQSWLRRLLSGQPHMVIGGHDDPYLRRWYLIPRNPALNIYLHQFLRDDYDRALHDHPWWFVSLMLRGAYTEITERGPIRRRAGSIAFRPAEWRHRVELDWADGLTRRGIPAWTLIVTGRRVRTWGFWCPGELQRVVRGEVVWRGKTERFIRWDEFGDAGCGETS